MANDLKQKALSGTKWSSILQFGKYGISFFLSIVLARLLDPEEFGLIGMLTIFTVIAKIFINSGLSAAIIRDKTAVEKDFSTVFYFNLLVSLLFYVTLYVTAPVIANFYDEPILIKLTRWVALVFVINAFGLIQNAILIRKIDFKTQSISHLTGLAVSALVGGFMAFSGYGVWSIVGQILSQAMVTNTLLWILSPWKPRDGFSVASFKKLWAFGSKVLATTLITQIIDNIDTILIGKLFAAQNLGFYTRAKSSRAIPQNIMGGVLGSVSFSVLSNVNDSLSEVRRIHLRFLKLAAFVVFPVVLGLIAAAKPFVVVLYSDKWLPYVPILQIIAFYAVTYTLGVLFSQTLMAIGKAGKYFQLNVFKRLVGLLSLPVGLILGLYPYLYALVSLAIVGFLLDMVYIGKELNISLKAYFIILIKYLFPAALMMCVVFSLSLMHIESMHVLLLAQIFAGLLIYWLFSVIFKVNEYYEIRDILKAKIASTFKRDKK
ncbi:MAG: lipopolysaccharide biosynthesis protein [Bacteroidales bacterium]